MSKLKFKVRLTGAGLVHQGQTDESSKEVLEVGQHSEKQEVLRDVNNRVNRDDLEILERYGALNKEELVKVMAWEEEEGTARIYVISKQGYVYVYQLYKSDNYTTGKVSLAVE